jgi:hypothetical protein
MGVQVIEVTINADVQAGQTGNSISFEPKAGIVIVELAHELNIDFKFAP